MLVQLFIWFIILLTGTGIILQWHRGDAWYQIVASGCFLVFLVLYWGMVTYKQIRERKGE